MSKTAIEDRLTGPQFPMGRIRFRFILEMRGGAYRDRTDDLKLAKLALSQLS